MAEDVERDMVWVLWYLILERPMRCAADRNVSPNHVAPWLRPNAIQLAQSMGLVRHERISKIARMPGDLVAVGDRGTLLRVEITDGGRAYFDRVRLAGWDLTAGERVS